MNIYARYFNQEALAHNLDELLAFLSSIPEIKINQEMAADMQSYIESDMPYPKKYKIRPRVYFILIKTLADTIDDFKNSKGQEDLRENNEIQIKKDQRINALKEERPGWYKGSLNFKRVIQVPETGKFQYRDTVFSALVKAKSGQECYENIIQHLKSRTDIDPRSQFSSARGNNFEFKFIGSEENFQNSL